MSEHYDEALIEDLGRVMTVTLGWSWPATPEQRIPSSAEVVRDEIVTPILDRLVELGWSPSVIHLTLDNTDGKFTPDGGDR